jgi:hypothetical protein
MKNSTSFAGNGPVPQVRVIQSKNSIKFGFFGFLVLQRIVRGDQRKLVDFYMRKNSKE